MARRRKCVVALVVAPPIGVACALAALWLATINGGLALTVALVCVVAIPAAIAHRVGGFGLAAAATAIALVEAFVLLLFLLSRANFG